MRLIFTQLMFVYFRKIMRVICYILIIKCTKNCSTGFKTRDVICAKVSKEGHILNITSNRCSLSEKPLDRISCNYGDCGGNYFWQPGHWSKVNFFVSYMHLKMNNLSILPD
jgi:hypothetical protein